MDVLPRSLVASLAVTHALAVLVGLRCVVFEKWATVLAVYLLQIGTVAALRSKTWGIGVTLIGAMAFAAAAFLGIGPAWFWVVGLVGVVPFILTVRPMVRFDVGATALFFALASASGVTLALAWQGMASTVLARLN
ncbi:MAG: hypothetical protein JWM74_2227 [Myxococcaceae bacterium]|nr:hypothetical protein [Myxococcaceae bacterium]